MSRLSYGSLFLLQIKIKMAIATLYLTIILTFLLRNVRFKLKTVGEKGANTFLINSVAETSFSTL